VADSAKQVIAGSVSEVQGANYAGCTLTSLTERSASIHTARYSGGDARITGVYGVNYG